jgi:hypothetical protein
MTSQGTAHGRFQPGDSAPDLQRKARNEPATVPARGIQTLREGHCPGPLRPQSRETTMKRMLFKAALIACAAVLLGPAVASAEPTTVTTVEKMTFNELFPNPCNGELVFFLGSEYTFVTHITFDSSDPSFGTHFIQNFTVSRSGTGLVTGADYEGPAAATFSVQNPGNPPFILNNTSASLIIGTGSLDDFLQHFESHTTVNANGTVTTIFTKTNEDTCKG